MIPLLKDQLRSEIYIDFNQDMPDYVSQFNASNWSYGIAPFYFNVNDWENLSDIGSVAINTKIEESNFTQNPFVYLDNVIVDVENNIAFK